MLRKIYQGGSSRKQGPRLAMRDADDEPPRDAQCGLANGLQRTSWIKQELRKNLTHICVTLIL